MWKYNTGLLLFNIHAGDQGIERKLKQALPSLSLAIKRLQIVQTSSLEEMRDLLKEEAAQLEIVIILGGDGTVHEVINVLGPLEKRPVIGILPGGTSNDFSRTLGIPQNITQAAKVIVEGNEREIDLAQSNTRYFLNFWGIGLIADSSENVDADEKNNFGVLSYFLSTVRTIQDAEVFSYELKGAEQELAGEAVLIVVFNGRFLGTREVGLVNLAPDDGKLDVFIVKESNMASFKEILSAVLPYAQNNSFEEIIYFQTKQLEIETKLPKEIDMDGEIAEKTPAKITLLPKHLRMIAKSDSDEIEQNN